MKRLRHDFAIGPQRYSEIFRGPARLYYCVRCKWNFMVGGRRVVVLDDDGRPIRRDASLRQFNSFAEGPCPVLEALVAATPAGAQVDAPSQFGMADPSANSRPVLRAHSRVRDGIVP